MDLAGLVVLVAVFTPLLLVVFLYIWSYVIASPEVGKVTEVSQLFILNIVQYNIK